MAWRSGPGDRRDRISATRTTRIENPDNCYRPRMPAYLHDVRSIAAQWGDDALHVWRLNYDPRHGRAPLLALLGAYLGLPAEEVSLIDGAHGRPRLVSPQADAWDFNWSHSGNCALVALGRQAAVGIDVERRRARPRALEVARRYFCPAEADWLASLPPDQRDGAFLALWTAKEAVLKALGRGLAFGLHRLEIAVAIDAPRLLRLEGEDTHAWQLRALDVGADHVATLAWRGASGTIRQGVLAGTV